MSVGKAALAVALLAAGWVGTTRGATPGTTPGSSSAGAASRSVPVSFQPNEGQFPAGAPFGATLVGGVALFSRQGVDLVGGGAGLSVTFAGAAAGELTAGDPGPGTVNVLNGADPAGWVVGAPVYQQLRAPALYPGVDLVWRAGRGGAPEFDLRVAPGADPGAVALRIGGAPRVAVDRSGDLVTPQQVILGAPDAAQDGRAVPARFVLRPSGEIGFRLGRYDRSRPLVIDPTLAYATTLGGDAFDLGFGVAVGPDGSIYTTGSTTSLDLPVSAGAFQKAYAHGGDDVFVSKLNPAGTALAYETYLGGSGGDSGRAIAVDASGSAVVTGFTTSADFPLTAGAVQGDLKGRQDAFALRLNPAGTGLIWSTLLGDGTTTAIGLALDAAGDAYVGGISDGAGFPVTPQAFARTRPGIQSGVVAKLDAAGHLVYATYLGGSGADGVNGVAVDASGAAYLTGSTQSADFPVTPGAFQRQRSGTADAFVAKLSPAGDTLTYASYLGAGSDNGLAVAVDSQGDAFVTGQSNSASFPVTPGALNAAAAGARVFVVKVAPGGDRLAYAAALGGHGDQRGTSVAVDAQGRALVGGYTTAADFPEVNPLQAHYGGGAHDGFLLALTTDGSALLYSTYLGSPGNDEVTAVALDSAGALVATGFTDSSGFPRTGPSLHGPSVGFSSAFVVKVSAAGDQRLAQAPPETLGPTRTRLYVGLGAGLVVLLLGLLVIPRLTGAGVRGRATAPGAMAAGGDQDPQDPQGDQDDQDDGGPEGDEGDGWDGV